MTLAALTTALHISGLFLGGTDFLVDYQEPSRFNVTKIEAHSLNLGVSFTVTKRCGFDVLPLIVGVDSAAHNPTYSAALFWRCYVWTP